MPLATCGARIGPTEMIRMASLGVVIRSRTPCTRWMTLMLPVAVSRYLLADALLASS
jgi:hypothetical protein